MFDVVKLLGNLSGSAVNIVLIKMNAVASLLFFMLRKRVIEKTFTKKSF